MNSKVRWGKIAWNMTRFTLRLVLITINALIEIGFDSHQKKTYPYGTIGARLREEEGIISSGKCSRIINGQE
jgi:hypothetical protein